MMTIGCVREESLVGNHEVVEQLLYHLKSMGITLYMHYIIQSCHQTWNVITSPGFEICGTVLADKAGSRKKRQPGLQSAYACLLFAARAVTEGESS